MGTIPAPGHNGYSAREILVLARIHRVPGRLISRSINGRFETRAYLGHQAENPWVIIAQPDQHYTEEL
jgi:hypothetical protein